MDATVPAGPISHRYDFVLLFDIKNGNPNGDPDAGNAPRTDPETGHGLVSDVSLKRKIRNYVTLVKTMDGQPADGFDIYVKERAILNNQHARAYSALGLKIDDKGPGKKQENEDKARAWMCQTFFDIRMFGAVMSTKVNAGQVRGPVQLAFGRSIDPIVSLEQAITRMAVTTEEEAKAQEGGNRTMGRKEIVPYGLYRVHGFISPFLAAQTGFSQADLDLLFEALMQMFEVDRSAARGEMASQRLFIFAHDSPLGGAPAHRLFERISLQRKDSSKPAREFADYDLRVDESPLPQGIHLHVRS